MGPIGMAEVTAQEWAAYSLTRIRKLVDKPREDMTDDELSIFTFASNALAGGDPVIATFERGPGHRLCRVCGAEWARGMNADHVSGCPAGFRNIS
jgi:hypothetical protein